MTTWKHVIHNEGGVVLVCKMIQIWLESDKEEILVKDEDEEDPHTVRKRIFVHSE